MKKALTLMLLAATSAAAWGQAVTTMPLPAATRPGQAPAIDRQGEHHAIEGLRRSAVRHGESDIIATRPEGTSVYYTRSGYAKAGIYGGQVETRTQSGYAEIVYAPDGTTCYLFNPVSVQGYDTWVRGTISGNTITVPLGQPVYYADVWDACISIGLITPGATNTTFTTYATAGTVTYTIGSNGTITLNGTSAARALGTFYEDDDLATPYCDYGTVYTPATDLPEGVTPPAGSEPVTYHHTGTAYYDGDYHTLENVDVDVVRDGSTFYFRGLLTPDGTTYLPDAWVKGFYANGMVFVNTQYAGMERVYPMYFMGGDYDGEALTASTFVYEYDEANDCFTALNYYFLNYDAENISYGGIFMPGNTLTRDAVEYDAVTLPDGLTIDEGYTLEGQSRQVDDDGNVTWESTKWQDINVALDGNDLYVQGLNPNLPQAWARGTLNDEGNYVFARPQFMGKYTSEYGEVNQFLLGCGEDFGLSDFALTYEATATRKQFTAVNDMLVNEVPNMIYYWYWYKSGLVIYKENGYAAGDVNGDGTIDINDVNIVINIVLGIDSEEAYYGRANVTGSDSIDVEDVNALINILLKQ